MTTVVDGTTGIDKIKDGAVVQADLAANVAGNGPVLKASTPATKSVGTGLASYTEINGYNTPAYDTGGYFNTTTGRFTPLVAGYYSISATGDLSSNGITALFVGVGILKNGLLTRASSVQGNGGYPVVNASDIVYCNGTTDYISVGVMQNSGSTYTSTAATLSAFLARAA